MNLPDISEALALGASALSTLKALKDLLPDSKEKEEAITKLMRSQILFFRFFKLNNINSLRG